MYKNEVMSVPYPLNLYRAIAGNTPEPEDMNGSIAYVLCALPERQREFVLLRYKHGQSYGEIGDKHGISRARAEAIVNSAIKTLQDPSLKKYVVYGVRGFAKEYHKREMQAMANREVVEAVPLNYREIGIYETELSTRAKNALSANDILNLGDLISYGDKIRDVRNLGRTSVKEIMTCLVGYGVNIRKYFPRTCFVYDIKEEN